MSKANKNDLIVQSNDLIEAYYDTDLTANEHKIIRYVASKIKINDNSFPDYSFEVREFANAAGVKGNNYHKQIEKIADEITKKRIKIKSKIGDKEKIGWFPWFSGIVYEKGSVEISFNPLIKSLLLNLENSFTKYSFDVISPLRSGYSIRLFELLKQYEKIGHRTIELEELRKMLGINDKYPEFANFKQRVLKHAQSELKNKTKLSFEFEEIKKSRKTVAIKFIINSKYKTEQLSLFEPVPIEINNISEERVDLSENRQVTKFKALFSSRSIFISDDILYSWIKEYGEDRILYAAEEIKGRKNIKHPIRYLEKILNSQSSEDQPIATNQNSKEGLVQRAIEKVIGMYVNSSEVLPDWLIKDESIELIEKDLDISKEEAQLLWEEHKDTIVNSIREIVVARKKVKVKY